MVKKRSLAQLILLSIVTLGIYPIVLLCIIGDEVNRICDGDGKDNMFYLYAALLGIVTLGMYPVFWCASAMDRLQDNAYRYGPSVRPSHSGVSFILWTYLGLFILVGPFIALAYLVSDLNQYANVPDNIQPLIYTADINQRALLCEGYQNSFNRGVIDDSGFNDFQNGFDQNGLGNENGYQFDSNIPATAYSGRIDVDVDTNDTTKRRLSHSGVITGVAGMYGGFEFPIEHDEEILIGTDPTSASIIIDIDNQNISPNHCSIRFDSTSDSYLVIDTSEFGTFSFDGKRLSQGMPKIFARGEMIYLGNDQNSFRFG